MAQRKMFSTFVLTRRDREITDEVWVEKMLLLLRCSLIGESDENAFAFVRYIRSVAPLDKIDHAPKYVCLQRATLGY